MVDRAAGALPVKALPVDAGAVDALPAADAAEGAVDGLAGATDGVLSQVPVVGGAAGALTEKL